MAEFKCCKRWNRRLYYIIMSGVFAIVLLIQLVSLGTFGVQFRSTNNFWKDNLLGSDVCVLYGIYRDDNRGDSNSDIVSRLSNNASCGFTLWGMVSAIIVLLVWIILQVFMAIFGRPKIFSLFRIVDLIVMTSMAFLSLIISSVLTDGLKKTCNAFSETGKRCADTPFDDKNGNQLDFFSNLNAAEDTSWIVTIMFMLLAIWYLISLFLSFCQRKYKKGKEEIVGKDDSDVIDTEKDKPEDHSETETEEKGNVELTAFKD